MEELGALGDISKQGEKSVFRTILKLRFLDASKDKSSNILISLLFIWTCLCGFVFEETPLFATSFQATNFAMDGHFLGADTLMNNDGEPQLVVFEQSHDEQASSIHQSFARFARFYERSSDPKEKLKLKRRVQIWQDAALYDVCALADGREELMFLRPDGLYRFGQAKPIVAVTTVLPFPSREQFNRFQFCQPLQSGNGKKVLALVIPTITGTELYVQNMGQSTGQSTDRGKSAKSGGNVFKKVQSFNTYADVNFFGQMRNKRLSRTFDKGQAHGQNMHVALEYAKVFLVDLNGDQRDDVCWAMETYASCVFQKDNGSFPKKPDWQQHFSIQVSSASLATRIQPLFMDLNGDGFSDFVIKDVNHSLSGMSGELFFFHNRGSSQDIKASGNANTANTKSPLVKQSPEQRPDAFFSNKPDQVIKRNGFFSYHEFIDLNGDGLVDMFFPWVELGWSQLASIYLSKEVKVRFYVALNKKGILQQPSNVADVTYPMDFKNWSAITGVLPLWHKSTSGLTASFFPEKSHISRKSVHNDQQNIQLKNNLDGPVAVGDEVMLFETKYGLEYVMGYVSDFKKRHMFTLVSPVSTK